MAAPGCLHASASPARAGKRKPNLLFMPALYWKFAKAKAER